MTIDAEKLFIKADKEWDKGNLKRPLNYFLRVQKQGM